MAVTLGSSLKGPFYKVPFQVAYYIGALQRHPNLENYPFGAEPESEDQGPPRPKMLPTLPQLVAYRDDRVYRL